MASPLHPRERGERRRRLAAGRQARGVTAVKERPRHARATWWKGARSLAGGDATAPLAVRLCRACVEILAADGGALTLSSTTPERLTVSTSDGVSARFEDLQEVLGEGPGQVAYSEGRTVIEVIDGLEALASRSSASSPST
ncbi:MAG: hypothetical protein K0R97_1716 [Oerskovia sp.]|nr:hypothetical protein [Oerskovia sp.]